MKNDLINSKSKKRLNDQKWFETWWAMTAFGLLMLLCVLYMVWLLII